MPLYKNDQKKKRKNFIYNGQKFGMRFLFFGFAFGVTLHLYFSADSI